MSVTLGVPTLSPFTVPPGPQSGRWRNMSVLPPSSALLLEGLLLLWLTFSLLCPKSVFKERPREAEEEAARAESYIHVLIPWQTGLRCRTRTEPPAGLHQARLAIRSWVQEVSSSVLISHL